MSEKVCQKNFILEELQMKNFFKEYREMKVNAIIAGILIVLALLLLLFANKPKEASIEAVEFSTAPVTTEIQTTEPETEAPTEEPTKKPDYSKLIDFDADYPFFIRINRAENYATVYGLDFDGEYTIPYKTFVCSTGLNPEDTPLGTFEISDTYRWRLLVDGSYGQYAMRIYGQIMLHSVPYERMSPDSLEYWEYNKLGQPASLGCIRFRVRDIRWIYKHCPVGTEVEVYSRENELPEISLPTLKKIRKSDKYKGWDPTDPKKGNPWRKKKKR